MDPGAARLARQCYYGMVTQIDNLVGEVVDAVEAAGLRESTIIVYTADHGETLGRHQLWHKMSFYEDSVRVPLIASCPSRYPSGERRSENVSLLDLFPTFMDAAGHEHEAPLDGESLLPLLSGGSLQRLNEVVAMSIGPEPGRPSGMLRRDSLKLILTKGYGPLLFDLDRDPSENTNFAGDPAYMDVLTDMTRALESRWDPDAINAQVDFNQDHLPVWSGVQRMAD
jgi:choline-sulfatase